MRIISSIINIMKRNPSNEEVYLFLDQIDKYSHNETMAELLERNYGIPSYIADVFIEAWEHDRGR